MGEPEWPAAIHGGALDDPPATRACDGCLARTWLIGRMAGHLDHARGHVEEALELDEQELIAALGGREQDRLRSELDALDVGSVRLRARAARLEMICACDPGYPPALRASKAPPAVLHVAGGLDRLLELAVRDPVAVVGSRRPTPYGTEMAKALGRGLACAGLTVVSGMALGIDSAAHAGALDAHAPLLDAHAPPLEAHAGRLEAHARPLDTHAPPLEAHAGRLEAHARPLEADAVQGAAPTVTVLPGSAHRPYPAGKRALHRRIVQAGAAVSELGPGVGVRRWMFLARNRIIAGLSAMTVVVEAGEHSGSLVTARIARELGRPVGAVPGRVTTPQAAGPHLLLMTGALLVRGPQDVLDHLFGIGIRIAGRQREPPPPELRPLLAAIAQGCDTAAALTRAGFGPDGGLAALSALELDGHIRRGPGGRFTVTP
jgi:DNA processing protein